MVALAEVDADSEAVVGDAPVEALVEEVLADGGVGSSPEFPHAATATNTSAPVAQDVNPSRFVMM